MNDNYMPQSLQGVPVIISQPVLVKSNVSRTWKERLFTRPFKPFTKTKEVKTLTETLLDGQIFKTPKGLVMNAKTFADCERRCLTISTQEA